MTVLCALSIGVILHLASGVFIPLVIAWFMLQIFRPVIHIGTKIKLPPFVNLILVLAVFVGISYIAIIFTTTQIFELNRAFSQYYSRLHEMTLDIMRALQIPPESMPRITWMDILGRYLRDNTDIIYGIFSRIALTLVFFVFMLLEAPLSSKVRIAFPGNTAKDKDVRDKLESIISSVSREVSRYLGTLTLISLFTAFCVWVVLEIMGVQLAVGWSVIVFFFNFIPVVGSIIATIPPVLMAVLQFSPSYIQPVLVLLLVSAIQFSIGNFVTPKVVGDRLGLSPVVILLSLLLWGTIWGIPGTILSVPIAAIIKIVCENFESLKPIAIMMGSGKVKPLPPEPEPCPEPKLPK